MPLSSVRLIQLEMRQEPQELSRRGIHTHPAGTPGINLHWHGWVVLLGSSLCAGGDAMGIPHSCSCSWEEKWDRDAPHMEKMLRARCLGCSCKITSSLPLTLGLDTCWWGSSCDLCNLSPPNLLSAPLFFPHQCSSAQTLSQSHLKPGRQGTSRSVNLSWNSCPSTGQRCCSSSGGRKAEVWREHRLGLEIRKK